MKYRAIAWIIGVFVVVSPIFGSSDAIPASLANQLDYLSFNGSSYPSNNLIGPYNAGYGGAFQPVISAANSSGFPTGTTYLTTVWCVDYQLDVSYSSDYPAYVTSLNNIQTPTDGTVRYGNLDNTSPAATQGWLNTLTDTGDVYGGANTADYRYTLAAALVSQYVDSNDAVDPQNPDGNSGNTGGSCGSVTCQQVVNQDQAIQEAIWYITANNDYPVGSASGDTDAPFSLGSSPCGVNNFSPALGTANANSSNYLCWVGYAEQNVTTAVNQAMWAVVSGPATVNGVSDPSNTCPACAGYNSFQTFLVQLSSPATTTYQNPLTPEPGFYGVLALGLSGLFFVRRKKKA